MNISIFRNITSKQPAPGTLEQVADLIRSDEHLKAFTASYRQTGSKTFKQECTLFAVACILEGGKCIDNIKQLTGLSLVDFDHITLTPSLTIDMLKQKIIGDPHTLMCYTTISGNGLRIIYRYEMPPDVASAAPSSTALSALYQRAFFTGNDYYEHLIGMTADGQCKNLTRLSGLAHDPNVFFRAEADAKPFTIAEMEAAAATHSKKSKEDRMTQRIQTYYDTLIAPQLAKDGIVFQPGSHNDYVMRVGYKLAARRFPKKVATAWAKKAFAEYADTEQVFTSCFSKAAAEGGNKGGGGGKPDIKMASVDEIKAFLDGNIQLRYNEITARVEYLEREPDAPDTPADEGGAASPASPPDAADKSAAPRWLPINDRKVNSLWAEMSLVTRVNKMDVFSIIESDYVPAFNPFVEYFSDMPVGDSPDGGGAIRALADTVRVKGGAAEQERWYRYLRKWLVAMVAGWLSDDTVNNVILVLIGEQGAFKTTWFNYLLPPELRQYFYTKTNANRMSKDDLLTLAQYALVCCEELDSMKPAELNQLKAAVTMPSINERAAYAHFHEHRQHIASFCGTGNNPQFLSDPTGNRRWLPFEVERIISPRERPFDYRAIYAEAHALFRSGFTFWFEKEDMKELNRHNQEFEAPHLEKELVDLYFRKPGPSEPGEFISVARALQIISAGISQKLSAVNVGRAFTELNFERIRTKSCRGFIVVCRTAEDMKAYQFSQLGNALTGNE